MPLRLSTAFEATCPSVSLIPNAEHAIQTSPNVSCFWFKFPSRAFDSLPHVSSFPCENLPHACTLTQQSVQRGDLTSAVGKLLNVTATHPGKQPQHKPVLLHSSGMGFSQPLRRSLPRKPYCWGSGNHCQKQPEATSYQITRRTKTPEIATIPNSET